MFERFSERGRQVIVFAQEEARRLRHGYIGTEHLLLGLLREQEGVGARSLESLGITLETARAEVLRMVGAGEEGKDGQIPFTPRAKKVLELSLREALSLGDRVVDTEHILLGLMRETEGVAARILLDLDADSESVRDEVIRELAGRGPGRRPLRPPTITDWFDGLSIRLDRLGAEIDEKLDRSPDSGDLLLVLACVRESLAGQALNELGVDLDALGAAVERARSEHAEVGRGIESEREHTRKAKEQAVEAGEFDEAARLRDRERRLSAHPRAARLVGSDALEEFRRRTGLPENP
jgi:ATP-dependent Clp protease ATP-binding subunit ClpA